jgi:UDP-glucose 4-epimerase
MAVAYVTGVAGFIGSHLAERLLEIGFTVRGCDNLSTGKEENVPNGVLLEEEDINALTSFDLGGVDILFHTAAIARSAWEDDAELWQSNLHGTIRIMREAQRAQIKSVVYSSSCSVIYPDLNVYSYTKNLAEMVALSYGAVSLRYSNVYGPRQSKEGSYPNVLAAWKKQFEETGKIIIHGDGMQKRDFIHVYDVVEANIKAMYTHKNVYDVCTGDQQLLINLARKELNLAEDQIVFEGQSRGAKIYNQDNTDTRELLEWKVTVPRTAIGDVWNSL